MTLDCPFNFNNKPLSPLVVFNFFWNCNRPLRLQLFCNFKTLVIIKPRQKVKIGMGKYICWIFSSQGEDNCEFILQVTLISGKRLELPNSNRINWGEYWFIVHCFILHPCYLSLTSTKMILMTTM